jgi:hypothetical protein
MSLAMKRLKNIGWLALVFLVLITLYPLSLHVASMHSDLVNVDNKILSTKREISFLQAELRTRASMQQLEEWNDLQFGYSAPTADQFLKGEAELASLGGRSPITQPVMIAASTSDGVAPAGIIGSVMARMPSTRDIATSVKKDVAPKSQDQSKKETRNSVDTDKDTGTSAGNVVVQTRTEKLAQIDRKLLSDDFMREIEKKSAQERKKR